MLNHIFFYNIYPVICVGLCFFFNSEEIVQRKQMYLVEIKISQYVNTMRNVGGTETIRDGETRVNTQGRLNICGKKMKIHRPWC